MIKLTVTEEAELNLNADTGNDDVSVTAETEYAISTDDYEQLKNLPKLNGVVIKGNVSETDPTVPAWAKADSPSETITADEINAVSNDDVISLAYLASLFS